MSEAEGSGRTLDLYFLVRFLSALPLDELISRPVEGTEVPALLAREVPRALSAVLDEILGFEPRLETADPPEILVGNLAGQLHVAAIMARRLGALLRDRAFSTTDLERVRNFSRTAGAFGSGLKSDFPALFDDGDSPEVTGTLLVRLLVLDAVMILPLYEPNGMPLAPGLFPEEIAPRAVPSRLARHLLGRTDSPDDLALAFDEFAVYLYRGLSLGRMRGELPVQ